MTRMTDPMTDGPGLFELARENGEKVITNVRRLAGSRSAPGRGLINTAAILLGLLDAGLFAISLAAQYQYILHAKHQSWPAVIEAVALDAGMVIFSLLALGLARGRQAAPVERALIVVCAFGSAAMNYGAADVSSLRSVAAYVMPPVFLAIVTDRVIAVVRRHMLGMEAERSAWAVIGRVVLAVVAAAGKAVLYGLRLVLAPRSTCSGARTLVLLATPLPGAHALVQEHAQVDAALAALGTVRTAIGDELRELRDRHELTAAHAADSLRAAQEAFRTETASVRDTVCTEIQAVREAARTEADSTIRAALGTVSAALGEDLRELRKQQRSTAANLTDGLRAAQQAFLTEIEAVRDTLRTQIEAVRDTVRAEVPGVPAAPEPDTAPGAPAPHEDTREPADVPVSGVPTAPEPGVPTAPYVRKSAAELLDDAEIQFADLVADRKVPSLRQIKDELHISQYRARKVREHLTAVALAPETGDDRQDHQPFTGKSLS